MEETYCEECCTVTNEDSFDYRFERPVCQECVYALNLIPDLIEGAY
jgi:hypothetical protein